MLLLAWSELSTPVDLYGPPPLSRMLELFLELNYRDIEIRVADELRPPLREFARAHFGGEIVVGRDLMEI